MIYRVKILCYYIEVLFSKLLHLFGVWYDVSIIPIGHYCYVPDNERNKEEPFDGYWISPCKYYRGMKGSGAACVYVGFIGFDICLGDQCKICGQNIETIEKN